MELRHLRYFVAVAEQLSFRRAAERLHLTRPALSKQIKELEEELEVRLLDRTTAKVNLTAAGAVYLQEIREVLSRADRAGDLAREAANGKRGRLVIGEPGVLGLTFLTPVLTAFRDRFPDVEITLKERPPNEHAAAVASGEIQVGFTVAPDPSHHVGLESLAVLTLRVGVAVGKRHPFAQRRIIPPEELAGAPLICIGDSRASEHAEYVRQRFSALGLTRPRIRMVSGIRSLTTMVASGHGISLLPDLLAARGSDEVVVIPVRGAATSFDFELLAIWRKHEESRLVLNFVQVLRRFSRDQLNRPAEELGSIQRG